MEQEQIEDLITQCLNMNSIRYNDQNEGIRNKLFKYNGYYIKPMFDTKYSTAMGFLKNKIDDGIENPTINIAIYNTPNTLTYMNVSFNEFKELYNKVAEISCDIEDTYQSTLATVTNLPSLLISNLEEALTTISNLINNNQYQWILDKYSEGEI